MFHILTLLILIIIPSIHNTDYAIVIDAGSQGSRMHLYKWDDIKEIDELTIPDQFAHMYKLSGYVGNETGLTHDFRKYIDNAIPYIPDVKNTKFYLGATAGLRLLSTYDAQSLIEEVRKIIRDEYEFIYEERHMRVLSGEEEGIFGWITVQYIKNDFTFATTYGALDMGGASTQISFIPEDEQILADKKTVKMFDSILDVYTHSFLKYGMVEAYYLSLNELLLSQPSGRMMHPCLFDGYSEEQLGRTVNGTSNVTACIELVNTILNLNRYCFYPEETCSVDGAYVPTLKQDGQYYAFSGFYYLLIGLKIQEMETITVGELKSRAMDFCRHGYDWALENSGFIPDYVSSQCFNLLYGVELLLNGYGFQEDAGNLRFVGEVDNKKVGWTLGNLLYEQMFVEVECHNHCSKDAKSFLTSMIIGYVLFVLCLLVIVILFIIIIILSCMLLLRKGTKSDDEETKYEPVN